ncbi:SDR family oxidoreductase [Leuconostoc gasicomitatum]|nr:aldehyde reductase [Leuconostoc gasicomitatum]MBZ5953145.1 aldehyde reductase [Leuconostoc gasicomitatum]MBZ5968807.1 aldehyde reductase [Leuconostoc gasicomitatum]MBZ5988597.1 aldehyde reductase [Leuconostoc gasicomitatum]MBZ5990862.1 aldehyde reductase [Leuconostoc gasicomitatum]MBZ5997093.1 aldehyde reductase [Leuconostoc gasicomitatum]
MNKSLVVVTGGSGFIAIHIINQLLQQGYRVRTTVRSLTKTAIIREMLTNTGITDFTDLEIVTADLTSDENWNNIMKGAIYVIDVASPTPKLNFKHKEEMIIPAVEGVRRVLSASRDAGVKRVVLTSAYGAIFAGHSHRTTPYTEKDWSDLNWENIHPYQESKTRAEMAAWRFIKDEGQGLELSVINPVAVMGPVLSAKYSHSNGQIKEFLTGEVKAVPNVDSGYVDVRDVASLHVIAMTNPAAKGERFLATTGETLSMLDVSNILRTAFPAFSTQLPTEILPNETVRLAAETQPSLKMVASLLSVYAETSNEKAKQLLNWYPRSAAESIIATAQSMIDLGIVQIPE